MNRSHNVSFFHFFKRYYPILRMRFLNTKVPTWYDLEKFGLTPAKFIHRLFLHLICHVSCLSVFPNQAQTSSKEQFACIRDYIENLCR